MNSVRTSQETHHVTVTEPNQLMLFQETVAVYCENHMEHTYTYKLFPYLTGNISSHVTEPNRLILCGDTVAVYCENRTEHGYI
jgi:hypothetical protein